MLLSALLRGTDICAPEREISDLVYDSRKALPGVLFVCLTGFRSDGHDFAKIAYENGCRVFACEKEISLPDDALILSCPSTRRFLAVASANLFGNPAQKLEIIGITGTKGKTGTSFMLRNILEEAGRKVGLIGTTGIYYGNVFEPSELSTPESYQLHAYFAAMLAAGCDTVVMETSSQGFKLDRTYGIRFSVGVFTNLSPDHINDNEHKDFAEYLACKKMLFSQCAVGVFNCDDSHDAEISSGVPCRRVTFGFSPAADFRASSDSYSCENGKMTTSYTVSWQQKAEQLTIPLLGRINVYNSLCACSVALTMKVPFDCVRRGLARTSVRGRFEFVDVPASCGFTVLIDYAHNEVSTMSVFETLAHYKKGRWIAVFGCGGNRSKLRRLAMGDIITRHAEIAIITSDNPRFEELDDIIRDIQEGITAPVGEVKVIKDRGEAIRYALSVAQPGDAVLLLGKGQQDFEEIRGERTHFDEREIVADYFKNASR